MAKEFSPEERLLNLIKKKKKPKPPSPRKGDSTAPLPPKEEPTFKSDKGEAISLSNIIKVGNIKTLNMILFFALIMVLVYVIIDIFLIPAKEIAPLVERGRGRPLKPAEELKLKPFSHYSKGLSTKDVFKGLAKEQKGLEVEIPVEELMGDFSLLGIVSGENPQAIIEDSKKRKTFFLREGQSAGGLFLKKIEDSSVTVIYKGHEINLTM